MNRQDIRGTLVLEHSARPPFAAAPSHVEPRAVDFNDLVGVTSGFKLAHAEFTRATDIFNSEHETVRAVNEKTTKAAQAAWRSGIVPEADAALYRMFTSECDSKAHTAVDQLRAIGDQVYRVLMNREPGVTASTPSVGGLVEPLQTDVTNFVENLSTTLTTMVSASSRATILERIGRAPYGATIPTWWKNALAEEPKTFKDEGRFQAALEYCDQNSPSHYTFWARQKTGDIQAALSIRREEVMKLHDKEADTAFKAFKKAEALLVQTLPRLRAALAPLGGDIRVSDTIAGFLHATHAGPDRQASHAALGRVVALLCAACGDDAFSRSELAPGRLARRS